MAANGLPKPEDHKTNSIAKALQGWSWAIVLVAVFAIAAAVLTRPDVSSETVSSVSGLMTLKTTAQDAVPYDAAMANHKPTLVLTIPSGDHRCSSLTPAAFLI